MDGLVAHRRAQDAFARVLADVTDTMLDETTPCEGWRVRDVIHHVIGGNARVAGEPGPVGASADDLRGAHAASAHAAASAFAAPDGLTRTFDAPLGAIPGAIFIRLRITDALTHAWDVATATGRSTSDLDPDLAAAMLDFARGLMRPELRGPGRAFAAEQPCPDDASAVDRLAAFLGRRPAALG
ncbi:MAG: TIGR03086 family protein [Actinobacteria bacterium]|nr:TIGR03086 family protein [Actinomycetota bacterium]